MMPQVSQDVVELLETVAVHPEGEHPLFEGDLESVAALYQVHPARIEAARLAFGGPGARLNAAMHIDRTRKAAPHRPARVRPAGKDVEAIISMAMALPHGLELLTDAPMEMAAVLLGAHPFVVEEARLRLLEFPMLNAFHHAGSGDLAS